MLIEMGFDVLEISARLKDESVKTTLDTYSHLYPDKAKKLAGVLNRLRRPDRIGIVFSLISLSSFIFSRSSFIITTCAESIAIYVPEDIETPISDVTKLTLSFIPSPHIITNLFSSFNFFIMLAFSEGTTLEITFVIPISFAIFSAVSLLSPC